ncbi:unnamed protein product [Acanthoscelides obtectus]|uniref:Essential MCU regulator, mitochondrial n=1 Tax=Acanthoscelides obtectus TaxID=200917 RepID=A0A9P0NY22_ACAOB|nr:unnamed protein product [Acanthoscelides obtectus]CAK1666973.1 Essential MCU regulator, mitochondrial [Acanthoscelides obtectus]
MHRLLVSSALLVRNSYNLLTQNRTKVFEKSGAIRDPPHQTFLALIKVFSVVIPGLTMGGYIGKNFAWFLDEYHLFSPADDDDRDDDDDDD